MAVERIDDEQIELPPGFRFHPTDEELITFYLIPKTVNTSFCARAITDADLNKVEPWDLPWMAKIGEIDWYFFCVRDKKYPTGLRTNRATAAGYWKATGKDREIFKGKSLVGMKKTLVFYKGRAPKGVKTNWVLHEYRLEGKYSSCKNPQAARNDWVICRIFRKSSCGKKTHISNLRKSRDENDINELQSSDHPPLIDTATDTSHVTCFSQQNQEMDKKLNPIGSFFVNPFESYIGNIMNGDSLFMQEQSMLKLLLENDGSNMKNNIKTELSQDNTSMTTDISCAVSNHELGQRSMYEDQDYPSSSYEHVNLDCFWNY